MSNLALNKPASTSCYIEPFSASRAVDGSLMPVRRWVGNSMPCWLKVDFGSVFWIERWVVKHMGAVGWSSPDYNMKNYKLQGSMDNVTWSDMDTVSNNTASTTDRTFPLTKARFVRVYVTTGLNTNQTVASIAELEVYGTQSLLSALAVQAGRIIVPINPAFNPPTFDYSASVVNSISTVTVTPTAQNSSANITVNGKTVISGQASPPIDLNLGQNTITVVVTSAGDDQRTYTITVTRENP